MHPRERAAKSAAKSLAKSAAKSLAKTPPPGAPWDLAISQAPLAFVDLEMTGLDVERDRVVEVCVDRVVGGQRTAFFHTLLNPGERLGGGALVHGIGEAEVAQAPAFGAAAGELASILEGAILVAHAAAWDVRFLLAELGRVDMTLELDFWLDTLVLARRAFAMRSYSLDSLCRELGIERGRAHRADSDVRAMRDLFQRCIEILRPSSARDLWEVRVGDKKARQAIVDACEAAVEHGAPLAVTYRAAGRPPEPLSMVVLEVRSDLDPPRIVGYLLPGRGRRELRADRILRVEPAPALNHP
jgi:DNA polymerase-3 subunit epsilon